MRHLVANLATYALALGLAVGAALFAWGRSAQLVIATEADVEPAQTIEVTSASVFSWRAFGARVYLANCQNCHTADGSGRGMYPPVQNQAAHLRAEGGRGYLVDAVLYGLYTGTYGAPMPPMPELSDAEIAAVTNYVLVQFAARGTAPDTSQLYLPSDVAERRGRGLSEWDVAETRPSVPSAEELGRGVRVPLEPDVPAVPPGNDE
jgi:mono/diheme cytochrome c family protein